MKFERPAAEGLSINLSYCLCHTRASLPVAAAACGFARLEATAGSRTLPLSCFGLFTMVSGRNGGGG